MKIRLLLGALLLGCCPALMADPYYSGNSYTPYPPGCVTLLERQAALYGDNAVRFWSGSLWLDAVDKVENPNPYKNLVLVDVDLYRIGCAEPNRSVIMVEFRLPPQKGYPTYPAFVLPAFFLARPDYPIPFELKPEPNGWGHHWLQQTTTREAIGDYTDGWADPSGFVWRYVLDFGLADFGWHQVVEDYNHQFGLEVRNGFPNPLILVPATREILQPNPALPLNGRLTGAWVEEGAADQGFLLSFSNPVPAAGEETGNPEDSELVVFLSWFTFGPQGENLWLAGNARFPQGSTEVSLPIVQVSSGEFMGSRAAERVEVGEIKLSARNCNALELDYDLDAIGLTSGQIRLQRLEALEIAGYPCRDYQSRQQSVFGDPGL